MCFPPKSRWIVKMNLVVPNHSLLKQRATSIQRVITRWKGSRNPLLSGPSVRSEGKYTNTTLFPTRGDRSTLLTLSLLILKTAHCSALVASPSRNYLGPKFRWPVSNKCVEGFRSTKLIHSQQNIIFILDPRDFLQPPHDEYHEILSRVVSH